MSKGFKYRTLILILFIILFSSFGILRLVEFQIVKGEEYSLLSQRKITSNIKLKADRGSIVDRYGRPLAVTKNAYSVVIDKAFFPNGKENDTILELINILSKNSETWNDELPITLNKPYEFIEGKEQQVKMLKNKIKVNDYATAQNCIDIISDEFDIKGYSDDELRLIAGIRYSMLLKDFSVNNRYTFCDTISKETAISIRENNYLLRGIIVVETGVREYVSNDIAPHLIGITGPIYEDEYYDLKSEGYGMEDKVGKSGIEKSMEKYLRGSDGVLTISQDYEGNLLDFNVSKDTVNGNTVVLSIDSNFQIKVQKILENHIKRLNLMGEQGKNAFAGAVSVLDTKTGDVLALANYPSYNINEYNKKYYDFINDKNMPLFNRSLEGVYRPGSSFKTIVSLAALAEGIIDEDTTFYCNGVYNYFGTFPGAYRPTCTGRHGNIGVVNALKYSCNIFYYEVGRMLGIEKINEYAKLFGLGDELEFDVPTKRGQLASPLTKSDWVAGDVVQASIGQSETYVTPLQMGVQAMTLANNGVRYRPNIVKYVVDQYNGEKVLENAPKIQSKVNVSSSFFDIVKKGMIQAASRVYGKYSLTSLPFKVALKTGTPQISEKQFNSTVVAYAPVENPEIAISVIVEKGEYTNQMIRQIIEAYYESKREIKNSQTINDSQILQ